MRKKPQFYSLAREGGGLTFMEVLVTFIMVVIAVIVTTYSLFYSHRTLRVDMHKQQVVRMLQERMEYWVGRWYITYPEPTSEERQGGLDATMILDPDSEAPLTVNIYREGVVDRYNPQYVLQSGEMPVHYRVITLYAEWDEHDGLAFRKNNSNTQLAPSLTTYVTHP